MGGNNVLILGGTREAYEIAEYFQNTRGINIISSLAGITRFPRRPTGRLRVGGFGGVEGLKNYLLQEKISLVVDVTHPFAEKITQNAAKAGKRAGVPVFHFSRKPWMKEEQDFWYVVESAKAAAKTLMGAELEKVQNIFLTIGKGEIGFFQNIKEKQFYVRSIEPVTDFIKFSNMKWIEGRGPFSYDNECAFFKKNKIDCLVAKNSGGPASQPKIKVARLLNLPVILIKQPTLSELTTINDVKALITAISEYLSIEENIFTCR